MADHIKLRKAAGNYSIRAAGAVLGESSDVVELTEGSSDPVLYVPRSDLAMAFSTRQITAPIAPIKAMPAISP